MDLLASIKESLINMDRGKVVELTRKALDDGIKPEEILGGALTPGMELVGQSYERDEIFIPEMLMSAEAMQGAMELLRPVLTGTGTSGTGKVIIGTVEGDVHDIGQQIVSMMLEGAGFQVFNLGIDVPAAKFVEKAKVEKPDIIGMSAFLSTTGIHYQDVIKALQEAGLREQVKIIIGGAAASKKYAETIGADGYGADAIAAVKLARSFLIK
jgi:5-methyltetrahydrofolate--homocysteine methyltransferase